MAAGLPTYLMENRGDDSGAGHGWIPQRPGDRNLTRWTLNPFADFAQALDQREISRKPRLLKLDVATSPIAGRKCGGAY